MWREDRPYPRSALAGLALFPLWRGNGRVFIYLFCLPTFPQTLLEFELKTFLVTSVASPTSSLFKHFISERPLDSALTIQTVKNRKATQNIVQELEDSFSRSQVQELRAVNQDEPLVSAVFWSKSALFLSSESFLFFVYTQCSWR